LFTTLIKNIRWQVLVAALLAIGAAVPASGAKRFTITSFGAIGDGKTSNTTALQALIDRVAKEGGGTVVVPEGTFLTGALFFKQGVNLYIEKNGTLKGSVEQNDYPQVKTRWEGIDSSRKVRVRNVDIDNNDDFITIKSGKDEDGLRVNRPSEDITAIRLKFFEN